MDRKTLPATALIATALLFNQRPMVGGHVSDTAHTVSSAQLSQQHAKSVSAPTPESPAALADCGIEVATSCRQGVCGTCVTGVLEGEQGAILGFADVDREVGLVAGAVEVDGVGDAVVQAYSRTTGQIGQDLYKIRIPMMLRWSKFVMSKVRKL